MKSLADYGYHAIMVGHERVFGEQPSMVKPGVKNSRSWVEGLELKQIESLRKNEWMSEMWKPYSGFNQVTTYNYYQTLGGITAINVMKRTRWFFLPRFETKLRKTDHRQWRICPLSIFGSFSRIHKNLQASHAGSCLHSDFRILYNNNRLNASIWDPLPLYFLYEAYTTSLPPRCAATDL